MNKDACTPADDPVLALAAAALEPARIVPHLERLFGPLELRRAELVRHKPGRRALVAYTLGGEAGERQLVGKVRAKGSDRRTHLLQTYLWSHGFGDASADGVGVAEPLGVLGPFHLTLQRSVPGTRLDALLLRPEAEALMVRVAEAAFKLHQSAAPVRREHTLADELAVLRRQLGAVAAAQPRLEARLERVLKAAAKLASGLPETRFVTLHRDFYPEQLLVSGARLYVLDLDLCARGDPALDVGNFAAHLREYALRVLGDVGALSRLEQVFSEHYCGLAGVPAEAVAGYALLSLTRHVAISQRLSGRRHLTEKLLRHVEGRLEPWLPFTGRTPGVAAGYG